MLLRPRPTLARLEPYRRPRARAGLLSLAAASWLALALPACSDPQGGGQIGGEKTSGCYQVTTTQLGLHQASPLGFSAADALVQIEGDRTETLLYAKGGDTALSFGALYNGGATRFVESEYRSYDDGPEPAIDCPPAVLVDIDVSFSTADGAFAETWKATARAEDVQSASLFYDIDLKTLAGSYQVTEVDPSKYDEVKLSASVLFLSSDASGSLTGQANRVESSGPDGVASSERFDVATF
jgi:hypothetical protein